jgi:hypothetical protein
LQAQASNVVQNSHLAAALALEAVMAKTGSNPVAQILQHQGDVYEWRDYPGGGVWDRASGYGYFYHCHPGAAFPEEHGHFHLFWAQDPKERRNLLALSMDGFGRLIGAFAPNAWHCSLLVGAEDALAQHYGAFSIQLAFPCHAANLWLSYAVRSHAPALTALHGQARALLADPALASDRGRSVVAARALRLEIPAMAPVKKAARAR